MMNEEWTCSSSNTSTNDSGVSTIDSSCSVQLQLRPPAHKDSFAEILMNEHNNNISTQIDVVKLLELKSTDDDDIEQHSNSSSLESVNSLKNHQGSQEREEEDSGSTSCSEDSFEMSSACSIRQSYGLSRDSRETTCETLDEIASENEDENESRLSNATLNDCGYERCRPSSSYSVDSFIAAAKKSALHPPTIASNLAFEKIRSRVANQIEELDTGLPNLDFDKLEKQLTTAAQEREDFERRMLGEEVRRRLAMQVDTNVRPSPQIFTRPQRSNLALRLQTAMNLQVCYMNEMSESETENETEDSDDSDIEFFVRKSKSAPNLKSALKASSREAQRIKVITERLNNDEEITAEERVSLLNYETQRVSLIAKELAEESLADYRRGKSKASDVPRQARQYLSKMKIVEIAAIKQRIEDAIARKNMELVKLLMERDSLHMEHDSLQVDIDDVTQHDAQSSSLNLNNLMKMQEDIGNPEAFTPRVEKPNALPAQRAEVEAPQKPKTTPITPQTTPTTPTLSLSSVLPNSFSITSFFRR